VSLKYALLGFLDMQPLTGYDLMKMFSATVKYYWSATHTQIYRTLAQMLEQGLLSQEIIQQTKNPNKKIYSITERGNQALLDWLGTPEDLPPVRHKFLVKITLANKLDTPTIINLLENYCEKLRSRLELYRTKNREITEKYARSEREKFLWNSVLENGIVTYECELKWAEKTIDGMRRLSDADAR
jgi:PadR family transcriptional regulator AphA